MQTQIPASYILPLDGECPEGLVLAATASFSNQSVLSWGISCQAGLRKVARQLSIHYELARREAWSQPEERPLQAQGGGVVIFYEHSSCYPCGDKASLSCPQCSAKKEKDLRLWREMLHREQAEDRHDRAVEVALPFWSLKPYEPTPQKG